MSETLGGRRWGAVLVAGTGPSFSPAQAELIAATRASTDRLRVIAVNDAYRLLPFADVLYACDTSWWELHIAKIRAAGFAGELWTQSLAAADAHGLSFVHGERGEGLTRRAFAIYTGMSSGYQAIGLARLFGALRILLVGFDYSRPSNGKAHFFGDHPKALGQGDPRKLAVPFPKFAGELKAAGVDVRNCTAQSALTCFPRASLDAELAALDTERACC